MTETVGNRWWRSLYLLPGLASVGLAVAWSAGRPPPISLLVERASFSVGTIPGGDYQRHSWVIHNDSASPLKLRTRFTSGRSGFSLWLGQDYFVPAKGLLTVWLTIPSPARSAVPFAGYADVLTSDPERPRLRLRIFGITGPSRHP